MKRILHFGMGLALAALLTVAAAAQSLGEYARQQRAQKPPTQAAAKVYTNENLPASGGLTVVGQPEPPPPPPLSPEAAAAAEKTERASAEASSALEGEWRVKFFEQNNTISKLYQELSNLSQQKTLGVQPSRCIPAYQRPGQMAGPVGSQHFEPGATVPGGCVWDWANYQKVSTLFNEKQKSQDEAKQKLEDMKEELRKAGLPASWTDGSHAVCIQGQQNMSILVPSPDSKMGRAFPTNVPCPSPK
jgi:hypothetical protein